MPTIPEAWALALEHYRAGRLRDAELICDRLSSLRAGLRQRMRAAPLCDGKRFAANLMQLLRDVWREWC
jgi:hypothetical protein